MRVVASNRPVRGLAAVGVGALLAAFLTSPPAEGHSDAAAQPKVVRLGQAAAGFSVGRPSVLVTRDGTTLVAWRQYGTTPNSLHLVRKAGQQAFASVAIPRGGLTNIGEPYLTEDAANNRILLTASGDASGPDHLGLYVWTSGNQGKSWTGPTRVWDSFASGQITLDGHGGFYAITDLTGITVTHVPGSLDLQTFPDDDIVLSDRLGSRGAIGVATTGKSNRLMFAWGFQDSWVHVGAANGRQHDVKVIPNVLGDGATQITGDRVGAVVVAMRELNPPAGRTQRLYSAGLVERSGGTVQRFDPQLVSGTKDYVVSFSISAISGANGRPTGNFRAVWLEYSGKVRTAHSTGRNPDWSKPTTIATFPLAGYNNPSLLANDGGWTAMHALDKNGKEVEIAVR